MTVDKNLLQQFFTTKGAVIPVYSATELDELFDYLAQTNVMWGDGNNLFASRTYTVIKHYLEKEEPITLYLQKEYFQICCRYSKGEALVHQFKDEIISSKLLLLITSYDVKTSINTLPRKFK